MDHKKHEKETVACIREELREIKSSERKHFRDLALGKKRPFLGENLLSDSLSPEDVVALGRKLKKKPLSIPEYRNLQTGLIQSEENINTFLSVSNVISTLVRDLSGNNPAVKLAAANCCCNIALGNSKACFSLAKSAVPYLDNDLDSLSYSLAEVCAWTIGNLAVGNDKAFAVLLAQNCVKHLARLMSQCDSSLLPAIVYALLRCIFVGHKDIEDEEMVAITKAIVSRMTPVDPETLWMLALLSSRPKCIEHLIHPAVSIIDRLYESLQNEDHDVVQVTAMIRILGNVVCEPSGQVAEKLLDNSHFSDNLLGSLLTHSYDHVRKETLWLIGNVYNHAAPHVVGKLQEVLPRLTMLKHVTNLVNEA